MVCRAKKDWIYSECSGAAGWPRSYQVAWLPLLVQKEVGSDLVLWLAKGSTEVGRLRPGTGRQLGLQGWGGGRTGALKGGWGERETPGVFVKFHVIACKAHTFQLHFR